MNSKRKFKNFESALARLEEITGRLESGDACLEESISLYTEGMEIAAFCTGKLAEAEKKIMMLKKVNGELAEIPFHSEEPVEEESEDEK